MMIIDVAIELIIPDNTAFTVLTALRRLGYEDLMRVERSEHVVLHVAPDASPEAIVAYVVGSDGELGPGEFEALVRDKDEDNTRLVALLSTTFGMSALADVVRGVGWRLYDEAGPAGADRLSWACQMLLANPISQTYDIRPRPVRRQVGELRQGVAKEHR
jgi:phosphoribosylformylglycinamidine (FGAM) synthase PurS component